MNQSKPVHYTLNVMKPAAILGCLLLLAGCSSAPRVSDTPLETQEYARGFEVVKDVLREYRFELERIDARHGVITTRAKPTAGLITPWDKEQSTPRQELEELVNQELRAVRVEFVPIGVDSHQRSTLTPADTAEADFNDLRSQQQTLRIVVTVNQLRVHRPGRQLSTKSIRNSTMYADPALSARGLAPMAIEELGRDEKLESRLLAAIEKQLAEENATATATESSNESK